MIMIMQTNKLTDMQKSLIKSDFDFYMKNLLILWLTQLTCT